jgi:hypothetical protein
MVQYRFILPGSARHWDRPVCSYGHHRVWCRFQYWDHINCAENEILKSGNETALKEGTEKEEITGAGNSVPASVLLLHAHPAIMEDETPLFFACAHVPALFEECLRILLFLQVLADLQDKKIRSWPGR